MTTEAKKIAARIASMDPGKTFTAVDFSDLASTRNAGNVLGRMHARRELARAIRGVYYIPERSELLGAEVPASVDEVVRAIARANKWTVAPAGDAALNALGLDEQVPAHPVYVSSGPYKMYSYGPYKIELKHRANRDLINCSPTTCTVIQALKTLGKNRVDDDTIKKIADTLSKEDVSALRDEAIGLTSWVTEAAKRIWEAKHGQNSED